MIKALNRSQMAWRVAQEIPDGSCVNLGIGLPLMVMGFTPADREVVFHSENGVLGMRHLRPDEKPDIALVNAGKQPVQLVPGGSFFHHADSFLMIRGGHIDFAVLGAYEVAENGDLANWRLGGTNAAPAVGGAMDLVYGAKKVFAICEHNSKDGSPKVVQKATLPITGRNCVSMVFTDLAVITCDEAGMTVLEMVDGLSFEELQNRTGARLKLAEEWKLLSAPDIDPPRRGG